MDGVVERWSHDCRIETKRDATYLGKTTLETAQGADEHLHVTLGERGHVDLLGIVRHGVRGSVVLMILGSLECVGFFLMLMLMLTVDG